MMKDFHSNLKPYLIITLPLYTYTTKSKTKKGKFILNLNNYRNAHYIKLNSVKRAYLNDVKALNISPKLHKNTTIHFKYYHSSKRRIDKSNPCSIIDKFAADAFTDLGWWEDDDSVYYPITIYEFCGVDKENPRCELWFYSPESKLV